MYKRYRVIVSGQYKLIWVTIMVLGFLNSTLFANESPSSKKKEIIVIHDQQIPRSEKQALIILPGLGDSKKGRKNQKQYFENVGYDLFIPDYIDEDSYDGTVRKFTQFYEDKKLSEYKKVHVFAYILGSWTINSFILKTGVQNITTIVYDRSPLQERAPRVIVEKMPRIGRMLAGDVLEDFSKVDYPPIKNDEINIGIIVESKATSLIRKFRKTTMSYGPIDWENLDLQQPYDEMIYTRLNHDEMYYTFDEIGADILEFIKHSNFKKASKYSPFNWDPFEKYKKIK